MAAESLTSAHELLSLADRIEDRDRRKATTTIQRIHHSEVQMAATAIREAVSLRQVNQYLIDVAHAREEEISRLNSLVSNRVTPAAVGGERE